LRNNSTNFADYELTTTKGNSQQDKSNAWASKSGYLCAMNALEDIQTADRHEESAFQKGLDPEL